MNKDSLGDRMKGYEKQETGRVFLPGIPIVARMDGRSFHKFTKNLKKPFDDFLIETMQRVTKLLVENTNADIGYTQSDEITLIWKNENTNEQLMFGGKVFKWHSILAAMTTMYFNDWGYPVGTKERPQMFDARV